MRRSEHGQVAAQRADVSRLWLHAADDCDVRVAARPVGLLHFIVQRRKREGICVTFFLCRISFGAAMGGLSAIMSILMWMPQIVYTVERPSLFSCVF